MKPFKVFLVLHSHIDIGYTERQEKMAIYQADFIKQAVDLALSPRQAERDSRSKFKFTAEGFWAVEQYLARYGEEGKKKLIQAVKSGCFELTGGYLHFAELLDYPNLSHSLDYSGDFVRENGLPPIETTMSCDINGFSWGFADALYDHGIRFLSTNINTHHGGVPFGKPLVPFWWESPKGKKIFVWNGLTYHRANILGLIPPAAPGGTPGVPGMKNIDAPCIKIENGDYAYGKLKEMIEALRGFGYTYDFVPVMASGVYTDNSPVGDAHCGLIADFNEKYGDEIQVETVTLGELYRFLMERGEDYPTYAGDWNDWWTDGVISTPNETKLFRNAQRVDRLVEKLDPEMSVVSLQEHEAIRKNLILYAEHTWGHSNSCSDPYHILVTQLDMRKAKLAIDADVMASHALDRVCRRLGEGEFTCVRPFTYHVVNPHPFPKEDVIYLPTDFWEDDHYMGRGIRVVDDAGRSYQTQRAFTLRGTAVACPIHMEAGERRTLRLEFSPDLPERPLITARKITGMETMENKTCRIAFGPQGVTSIVCKETGEELLDASAPALGAPVYQVFPGGQRGEAAGFGYSARRKPRMEISLPELISFEVAEEGEVLTHLKATYRIRGAVEAYTHIYIFPALSKILVRSELAKDLVRDPEGMYVSLPVSQEGGQWYIDKAGAYFMPGQQLPNGCCDYYSFHRGVVLSGGKAGVVINSLDTPLVAINRLKLWDYTTTPDTRGPLYFWVCNNKWETNFRTQCAGYLETRYVMDVRPGLGHGEEELTVLESNDYDLLALRE